VRDGATAQFDVKGGRRGKNLKIMQKGKEGARSALPWDGMKIFPLVGNEGRTN